MLLNTPITSAVILFFKSQCIVRQWLGFPTKHRLLNNSNGSGSVLVTKILFAHCHSQDLHSASPRGLPGTLQLTSTICSVCTAFSELPLHFAFFTFSPISLLQVIIVYFYYHTVFLITASENSMPLHIIKRKLS